MIPQIEKIESVNLITLDCGCSFVWMPEHKGTVDDDWIRILGPGMYCSHQPCSETTVRELLKRRGG